MDNPENQESYDNEVRIMRLLMQSRFYPLFYAADNRTILLEYIPGKSLEHYMFGYEWEFPQRLKAIKEVASAIQKLHEINIIHRDIKIANVLVRENGQCVLFDFGTAILNSEAQEKEPDGTLLFMAPEYYFQRPITNLVDIYAFAYLCWQMFACHEVWRYKRIGDIPAMIKQGERPSLESLKYDSHALALLISFMWHQNPALRFSISEICDILDKLLANLELAESTSMTQVIIEIPQFKSKNYCLNAAVLAENSKIIYTIFNETWLQFSRIINTGCLSTKECFSDLAISSPKQ